MRILITIPTWNEATIIERSLLEIQKAISAHLASHEVTIEVADNGSTDGTGEIVRRVGGAELMEIYEKGKGLAIRHSWERHLSDADVLVFMDADLATDLASLSLLVDPIVRCEADLVCGSRFVAGAMVERRTSREWASRLYRTLQQFILHLPVQDAQCGFKAIFAGAARKLLPQCRENGWLFDSEMLVIASRLHLSVLEIPVHWVEQRQMDRRSALRLWRDGWGFLLGLAKIRRRFPA